MDAVNSHPDDARARHKELVLFAALLLAAEAAFYWDALRPGWVLSAADWLLATHAFRTSDSAEFEPSNRLLTDIACQMEPWLLLARRQWLSGNVPLWNPHAGCGVPLLANAQSGVFNPFHFIYFITGSVYAWVAMAIAKQFLAGVGTFLFARAIGLGRFGRWFAGMAFPFGGFMVAWLQYPMGGVAAYFPLILWLVERLARCPSATRAGVLAGSIALMLLGGHPETAAHILMVAGLYCIWRLWSGGLPFARGLGWFGVAAVVGFLAAAVQLLPVAEYLRASRVVTERTGELHGLWDTRAPQLLAMPALAIPYVYGSYLRGQPHVEKALGLENFNELVGGYTGLATIVVLVPIGLIARRHAWLRFWIAIDLLSIAAAYHFPVVDHILRWVPVLNVTQNERLLLVVSLSHVLIGGAGLDAWDEWGKTSRVGVRRSIAGVLGVGSIAVAVAAIAVAVSGSKIHAMAIAHFEHQAELRGLDRGALREHADKFANQVQHFFPHYYGSVAAYAAVLAALIGCTRIATWRGSLRIAVIGLTALELFWFGRGLNPAIPLSDYFPPCPITEFLGRAGQDAGNERPFRVLVLDEEFPPNVLGRYEISDLRNYDAIELASQLRYFEPLWVKPGQRLTSNSWTTWDRIRENLNRLQAANVRFLLATTPPTEPIPGVRLTYTSNRVGVYELDSPRMLSVEATDDSGGVPNIVGSIERYEPGRISATVSVTCDGECRLIVSECHMPGWRCAIDRQRAPVKVYQGVFMAIPIGPGTHQIELEYWPDSVRYGWILSVVGLIAYAVLCGTAFGRIGRFLASRRGCEKIEPGPI